MSQLSLFDVVREAQKHGDNSPKGYHPAPKSRKDGWTDGHGNYWYPNRGGKKGGGEEKKPAAKPAPRKHQQQLDLLGGSHSSTTQTPEPAPKPRTPKPQATKPSRPTKPAHLPPPPPELEPVAPPPEPVAPEPVAPPPELEPVAPPPEPVAPEPDEFDLWDLMEEEGVDAPEEHEAELTHTWAEPEPPAAEPPAAEPPAAEPPAAEPPAAEPEDMAARMAREAEERRKAAQEALERSREALEQQLAQEAEDERQRTGEEERQKALERARAHNLASFTYGHETPPGAVLPRDVQLGSKYRLWEKRGGRWEVMATPPDVGHVDGVILGADLITPWSGSGAQVEVWEHILLKTKGRKGRTVIMPSVAVPEHEQLGGMIKVGEHTVSPDRPPNFLGLRFSGGGSALSMEGLLDAHVRDFGLKVDTGDPKRIYFTGDTYNNKGKLKAIGCKWDGSARAWWLPRGQRAPDIEDLRTKLVKQFGPLPAGMGDEWLAKAGFYDALYGVGDKHDPKRGKDVLRSGDWLDLKHDHSPDGPKRRAAFANAVRDLTAWWTGLKDGQREHFWNNYVNEGMQAVVGKVVDPRHEVVETATIEPDEHGRRIPKGMEKFAAMRVPYMDDDGARWADEDHTIPWEDRAEGQGKPADFHAFQKKAINFMIDHAPRALLAMEMGLGKTITAYGAFHELKNRGEVKQMLVVAPKSAMGSWASHARDMSDARAVVLRGASPAARKKAYEQFQRGELDVLVISANALQIKEDTHSKLSDVDPRVEEMVLETYSYDRRGKKIEADTIRVSAFRNPDRTQGGWLRVPPPPELPEWDKREGKELRIEELENAPPGALARGSGGAIFKKESGKAWVAWLPAQGRFSRQSSTSRSLWNQGARAATATTVAFTEAGLQADAYVHEKLDYDKETLRRMMEEKGASVLRVADEVHKFKNPNAKQSQGFWQVMTTPEGRVVGMTGTPKPNKVQDFYHVVNHIAPGTLGATYDDFSERYSYRYQDAQGRDCVAGLRPEKMGDLYRDSANVMFARTLGDPDCKLDMPPRLDLAPAVDPSGFQMDVTAAFAEWIEVKSSIARLEAVVEGGGPRAMAAAQELQTLRRRLEGALEGVEGPVAQVAASGAHTDAQTMLMRAQQLAISPGLLSERWSNTNPEYESPKVAATADAFAEHMKQNPDTGGVIFSTFNGGVEEMRRALKRRGFKDKDIGVYTGGTTDKKKAAMEEALNEGDIKVIIGNSQALETGANLQGRANFVAHLNTPWKPDTLTQSTARVWRQGQQRPVTVLRAVGSPVDALIDRSVSRKLMETGQVTGKTTEADAAAGYSVRSENITTEDIARVLGVDPKHFGGERMDPKTRRELGFGDGEEVTL